MCTSALRAGYTRNFSVKILIQGIYTGEVLGLISWCHENVFLIDRKFQDEQRELCGPGGGRGPGAGGSL